MLKKYSVSEIVAALKETVENSFHYVMVEGEISDLSLSGSGHYYFTLRDRLTAIGAVLFKSQVAQAAIIKKSQNGDQIICYGRITLYPKKANLQIIVDRLVAIGKGGLVEQLEELKKKLFLEGLFSPSTKKKIPLFPKQVAVVTSAQGAAVQDFVNVYRRRSVVMNLLVVPVSVQGEGAAATIIKAIHYLNKEQQAEVIVLTRGGGSKDDLSVFNDESLVRSIFASTIPVVSAIGHQVDYCLSDQVADFSCETPTAAAEILTQSQYQFLQRLSFSQLRLVDLMRAKIAVTENHLLTLSPRIGVEKLARKVMTLLNRVEKYSLLNRAKQLLPLDFFYLQIDELWEQANLVLKERLYQYDGKLRSVEGKLEALSPKAVLARGYVLVRGEEGLLKSKQAFLHVRKQQKISLEFFDGAIEL